MIVSNISVGAGSVAVAARPALPNTDSTSGNVLMIRSCVCSSSAALVIDRPGSVVGMYISVPSFRFGMNSEPSCVAGQTLTASTTSAEHDRQRLRLEHAADDRPVDPDQERGSAGLRCSGTMRPRTNITISAGTSVTDSSAAAAMAKVLVKASGLNSRPSCASSVKIGRNETVMISRQKNSAGPTSLAASIRISLRGLSGGARSRCLWAFSIMTMAASIIAPMAMAMPPRLMMFDAKPERVHAGEGDEHARPAA